MSKIEQEEISRLEYVAALAQAKYDYENEREQILVRQSGQMQSAFSIMTAAIFMLLPVIMENRGVISDNYIYIAISIIVFLLLISLVFATIAAWRWEKNTLGNIIEIKEWVNNDERFNDKKQQYQAKINALGKVQVECERINNKRASLIRISMFTFFISIASMLIFYIIATCRIFR